MDEGKIKAHSKWKEVYPVHFKDDERYLNILGNPGSNPLELFWDAVDALDQELEKKIAVVEGAIGRHNSVQGEENQAVNGEGEGEKTVDEKERGWAVGPQTTEEEFKTIVGGHADDAVRALTEGDLHTVYETVSCTLLLVTFADICFPVT